MQTFVHNLIPRRLKGLLNAHRMRQSGASTVHAARARRVLQPCGLGLEVWRGCPPPAQWAGDGGPRAVLSRACNLDTCALSWYGACAHDACATDAAPHHKPSWLPARACASPPRTRQCTPESLRQACRRTGGGSLSAGKLAAALRSRHPFSAPRRRFAGPTASPGFVQSRALLTPNPFPPTPPDSLARCRPARRRTGGGRRHCPNNGALWHARLCAVAHRV